MCLVTRSEIATVVGPRCSISIQVPAIATSTVPGSVNFALSAPLLKKPSGSWIELELRLQAARKRTRRLVGTLIPPDTGTNGRPPPRVRNTYAFDDRRRDDDVSSKA